MKGHITLDGREYILAWEHYQKSLDNPFAARVGTGGGEYDDLEGWSALVLQDFRTGAAETDPESGGFYQSSLDTRFKNRLVLPTLGRVVPRDGAGASHAKGNILQYVTLSAHGSWLAFRCPEDIASLTYMAIMLEAQSPSAVVQVQVWGNTAGAPDSGNVKFSLSHTGGDGLYGYGPKWHMFSKSGSLLDVAADDWIVIINSRGVRIPLGSDTGESYVGTTHYANRAPSMVYAHGDGVTSYNFSSSSGTFVDGTAYFGTDTDEEQAFVASAVTGDDGERYAITTEWDYAGVTSEAILDTIWFDGSIWTAVDGGSDVKRYDPSDWSTDFPGNVGEVFCRWNNYLYIAEGNNLWYTTGGSTPTFTGGNDGFQIGPEDYSIRGMSGIDGSNNILVSTDDGLFVFQEGDTSFGVTRWTTRGAAQRHPMVNAGGAVFVAIKNRIIRYAGGSLLDVWVGTDEEAPHGMTGDVSDLFSIGSILYAIVNPTNGSSAPSNDLGQFPSIWGWNTEGWHFITYLPQGFHNAVAVVDPDRSAVWVAPGSGGPFLYYVPMEDYGTPLVNDKYQYQNSGWLETGWIEGGLVEVEKDWESVYVDGEEFRQGYDTPSGTQNRYVEVYWLEDEQDGWKLLGTAYAPGTELIWSDLSTRPSTNRIKIGVRLVSDAYDETPIVHAIRVKYRAIISDRWRWQIPIELSEGQQVLDYVLNEYTFAEQTAHLEGLIQQVAPVVMTDLDGATYNVIIRQASMQPVKVEYKGGSVTSMSMYYLTVSQT